MSTPLKSAKQALYMSRPHLFELTTTVIEKGQREIKKANYFWIKCAQTIFHPQGGGQPSDRGSINGINVDFVNKLVLDKMTNDFEVEHCFAQPVPFEVGQTVEMRVDAQARKLHARMHTAGHLLAHVVEKAFKELKALGGNHFPGDGYLKFKGATLPDEATVLEKVNQALADPKIRELPAHIVEDGGVRKLKIGDFEPVGCGGTHLESLQELGDMKVGPVKVNKKEATVTVKYSVSE